MRKQAINQPEKQKVIEKIALDHLFIETLEIQHSDRLDFHDVSVWAIKCALEAAYAAGALAAQNKSTTSKGKK